MVLITDISEQISMNVILSKVLGLQLDKLEM